MVLPLPFPAYRSCGIPCQMCPFSQATGDPRSIMAPALSHSFAGLL
ncbi:hypothetical protein DESPIG_01543 [Desulfovibrio piger ATCC 29098]|uniref:Uncharacterized protein n=1 Tax=Desulfovibrio piger ATCC 29098 TaxID=411464 RepID=B6WTY5_9BACT|nr:hypothetical protein DESPIG_01543 [Desulfovibrio piger ATCC 29098]